jgi:hypothetical protein
MRGLQQSIATVCNMHTHSCAFPPSLPLAENRPPSRLCGSSGAYLGVHEITLPIIHRRSYWNRKEVKRRWRLSRSALLSSFGLDHPGGSFSAYGGSGTVSVRAIGRVSTNDEQASARPDTVGASEMPVWYFGPVRQSPLGGRIDSCDKVGSNQDSACDRVRGRRCSCRREGAGLPLWWVD